MKKMILAAATGLIALPVLAQVTPPAPAKPQKPSVTRAETEARVKERLGTMDADKDGTVTRDEMMAFADARMKARSDEMFAAMDTDKNGSISRAEFDAHHGKRASMMHMGGLSGVHVMQSGDGEKVVRIEKRRVDREGAAKQNSSPEGKGHRMHMMLADHGGMMMFAEGGDKIVIADAVKKALDRFDAADANKDGVLTPEERRAAREARRAAWKVKASS